MTAAVQTNQRLLYALQYGNLTYFAEHPFWHAKPVSGNWLLSSNWTIIVIKVINKYFFKKKVEWIEYAGENVYSVTYIIFHVILSTMASHSIPKKKKSRREVLEMENSGVFSQLFPSDKLHVAL